ncbi:prolyl oligopeptidase family serine peptidase [Novosphingobium sp. JCM 18896]|nr:prolyl oligopeptidase family serine peptidase [Novosphingobium sp. JCM 18896]MCW1430004.1 prolyl oligopeptidase family serine peptidase [Novosphingobium sp. JCM 18896]
MTPIQYPETRRGDVAETLFGETIADPYRWLENDVRNDPEVADWVARENKVTDAYLETLPQRAWFKDRIRGLMDYERFGLPTKAGGRYFYLRNSGLQNQAQLFVRQGLRGKPRLLLDPNVWAKDAATALDAWKPSDDGKLLLYSVQDGGSDWRILRVLDVKTGTPLADEIRWAKFTDLAWVGEEGFLYSRFPEPKDGEAFQARNYNQAIWFHRIGTPQSADELVYATPDHPEYGHTAQVTQDGRLLVIHSQIGTDARYEVHTIDLARRAKEGWKPRALVKGFEHDWRLVDGMGQVLWFVTNQDAPRYRLVAIDLGQRAPQWRQLVAQTEETLQQATIIGNQLVLQYLKDASSLALVYGLDGKSVRSISLTGIGTAAGFGGKPGDPETFYAFTSFNRPQTIYRMNLATGQSTPFASPELQFDPRDFTVEQRFYASKDGTRVPMFVVRKKGVAAAGKPVPTILYGYGGFDVSLTPSFSAIRMAWLEAGGAFALANLRGGGEYGRAWHDGGRRENKQNVFDDFIAAGEYLIAEGITPKGGLAIQGGSNGGLLVGAVVNQRPDLFAAANAAVGVMDMLRFDRFTAGRYWVDDYGYPDREKDFRVLRAYSPYHNIAPGKDYPAMLVTTADTDDRVVPGHSFKYTAALQAAKVGARPQLIRVETRAGHGSGKPTDKAIEEGADVLAFLAQWTGLKLP